MPSPLMPLLISASPAFRLTLVAAMAVALAGAASAQQPPRDSLQRDSARADSAARNRDGTSSRDSASSTGTGTRGNVAQRGSAASKGGSPKESTAATKAAASRPKPVWPVNGPEVLPGSILPNKRIVAYYGNPLSKRMGILGEVPPDEMWRRLQREVAAWTRADSAMPAIPALHLITVVAQAGAGRDGMYRARMSDSLVEMVYGWAQRRNAIMFLDIQVGKSTLQSELPRLEQFLSRPEVHLGLDPEFSMKRGGLPGKRIGTYDAADINYAIDLLASIVERYKLPPKVLVVHRFTRPMLTNASRIKLDPRVQVVINMDGWGPPHLKKDSYDAYVYSEPVQFTGFKLFYHNDTKRGHPLMKPADVLALFPRPVYIQYQ